MLDLQNFYMIQTLFNFYFYQEKCRDRSWKRNRLWLYMNFMKTLLLVSLLLVSPWTVIFNTSFLEQAGIQTYVTRQEWKVYLEFWKYKLLCVSCFLDFEYFKCSCSSPENKHYALTQLDILFVIFFILKDVKMESIWLTDGWTFGYIYTRVGWLLDHRAKWMVKWMVGWMDT